MFVQSLAGGGDLGELLLGLEEAFAVFPVFLEAGAIADDGDAAKLVAVVEEFPLEFSAFLFFESAEGADEFLLAFAGLLFKLRDAALAVWSSWVLRANESCRRFSSESLAWRSPCLSARPASVSAKFFLIFRTVLISEETRPERKSSVLSCWLKKSRSESKN